MLESVEAGVVYKSPTGEPCLVLNLVVNAMSIEYMVVYICVNQSSGAFSDKPWVMEESLFKEKFSTCDGQHSVKTENTELAAAILNAQSSKPSKIITGTIGWAHHMAERLRDLLNPK